MSKHFRISSRLPGKLQELGIRISAVLRSGGLRPDLFDQPRVQVTTEEFFALWRGIGLNSRGENIGLLLGTENKPEHFDAITHVALSTGSFIEAMSQIARYKHLSCPEEIVLKTVADEWSIQFRWLLATGDAPDALTDLCFAWVYAIARHGTRKNISPLRIELMRPRASVKYLERHFGCKVVTNATRDAIVFRASDAALPFVTRNAELLSMLVPQFEEELNRQRGSESFPERVRFAIQRKLTGRRPTIREIARDLHLSSRTLQRRLQDSGESFQDVLEQARHQLARYYLNNSYLELTETAYLLGYENSNSFVRAFRTWEGVPPAHWRESQRAKASELSSVVVR